MIVKKQYIPKRYRSKKLVNAGGGVAVGGSSTSGSSVDTSVFLLADKFTSLFEYDEVNDAIKAKLPFYSIGEVAAYGIGTGSGGGGTSFSRLDEWSLYTNDKSGWVLSALLGKELHDRVLVLEAGGGGGGIATEIDPTVAAHIKNITTGDLTNWATAYAKSHEHASNLSILNATTASFLTADRNKLDGIATGANNYTHPATHAPSIIVQDTNNRFVTDDNIATWNAKEPAITKGTPSQYFRGDMSLALFPTALPASDVHPWAKASTKPSYVWSEIGNKPTTFAPSAHTHYKSDIVDFAHTHSFSEIGITGLFADFLTKFNGSTLVNSILIDNGDSLSVVGGIINIYNGKIGYYPTVANFDSGGMNYAEYGLSINAGKVGLSGYYGLALFTGNEERISILSNGTVGIGTTTPTATLDVNGTGKFKDDILIPFYTWSNATDRNSLKKFLELFDLDTAGNLVVKTSLYSTGEIAALGAGTGVSALTLMMDMNANGKNINNLTSISKSGSKVRLLEGAIAFDIEEHDNQLMIASDGIFSNTYIAASSFHTSGIVESSQFKFGNWSFKEVGGNMVISYNGTAKATIQSSRPNSNL